MLTAIKITVGLFIVSVIGLFIRCFTKEKIYEMKLNKKKKDNLEQRVEELERLIKELIEYKVDKEWVTLDAKGRSMGYSIHEYNMK